MTNAADYQRMFRIFSRAIDMRVEQRDRFVRRECAGNDSMREMVSSMLRADADTPPPDPDRGGHPSTIGPYRIVRVISRGGMGVVYEAEQDAPRRTEGILRFIEETMPSTVRPRRKTSSGSNANTKGNRST